MVAGTWAGTWFMGKYEEPIELDLIQASAELGGRITMWGYPGASDPAAGSMVRVPLTGTVGTDRVRLTWTMPAGGQFSAELTLMSPGRLHGLGGIGEVSTGFELTRHR